RVLDVLVSISLAVLGGQPGNVALLTRLFAEWQHALRRLFPVSISSSKYRWLSPPLRLLVGAVTSFAVAVFKSLPAYQSLNLRELKASFQRPAAFRERARAAIAVLSDPEAPLEPLARQLSERGLPHDAYNNLVMSCALIVRGRHSPELVIDLI